MSQQHPQGGEDGAYDDGDGLQDDSRKPESQGGTPHPGPTWSG